MARKGRVDRGLYQINGVWGIRYSNVDGREVRRLIGPDKVEAKAAYELAIAEKLQQRVNEKRQCGSAVDRIIAEARLRSAVGSNEMHVCTSCGHSVLAKSDVQIICAPCATRMTLWVGGSL